jgi:hypothetical protein
MTGWRKRTIMDMAHEADIEFKTDVFRSDFCDGVDVDDLVRFAELVRADEREACAKLLEDTADGAKNVDPNGFVWQAIKKSAELIRARGQA